MRVMACSKCAGDGERALRMRRLILAHRIDAGGVARDLLASSRIEGIGLQVPGNLVQLFRRLQHQMRRRRAQFGHRCRRSVRRPRQKLFAQRRNMRFQVADFALQLIEQRRWLAQRGLQAADGIFEQRTVETTRTAPMLRQKPASARTFEQGLLDCPVLVFRFDVLLSREGMHCAPFYPQILNCIRDSGGSRQGLSLARDYEGGEVSFHGTKWRMPGRPTRVGAARDRNGI